MPSTKLRAIRTVWDGFVGMSGRLVQARDFSRAWRAPTRKSAQGIRSGSAFTQAAGYQARLGWVCGNGREAWPMPGIFRAHGALPHEDVHRASDRGAPSPKLRAIRQVWDGFVGTGGRPGPCPGFSRAWRAPTKMCAGHRIGERLQLSSGLSGRSGMGLWEWAGSLVHARDFSRAWRAPTRRCARGIGSGSVFN